jgi:hypothetical protein
MNLDQISLFKVIANEVVLQAKENGVDNLGVIPRQMNAIIQAANLVVEAFKIEERKSVPEMGVALWRQTDDTGMSSKFMASILFPQCGGGDPYAYPHDADDFGRCVRMLKAARQTDWLGRPEDRYARLSDSGREWKWLVSNWERLVAIYEADPSGQTLYSELKKIPLGDLESLVRTATELKGQKLKDRVKELVEGLVETKVGEAWIKRIE